MGAFLEFTLYFFIYSAVGYLIEVAHCSIRQKKLTNRGVLFGPILPIYGISAMLVIFVTAPVQDNLFLVFIITTIVCSALEYFTSWLIERLFGIKWWDYDLPGRINLNGRICLRNSIMFGLCGCLVVRYFQPIAKSIVVSLRPYQPYTSIILLVLFLLDIIASVHFIKKIKHSAKLELIHGDQTDEIKKLANRAIFQFISQKIPLKRYLSKAKKHLAKIRQRFTSAKV